MTTVVCATLQDQNSVRKTSSLKDGLRTFFHFHLHSAEQFDHTQNSHNYSQLNQRTPAQLPERQTAYRVLFCNNYAINYIKCDLPGEKVPYLGL